MATSGGFWAKHKTTGQRVHITKGGKVYGKNNQGINPSEVVPVAGSKNVPEEAPAIERVLGSLQAQPRGLEARLTADAPRWQRAATRALDNSQWYGDASPAEKPKRMEPQRWVMDGERMYGPSRGLDAVAARFAGIPNVEVGKPMLIKTGSHEYHTSSLRYVIPVVVNGATLWVASKLR